MKAKAGVRPVAQRAGVSKIPAWLVAKLYSGAAYMCCFDGGVTWGEELHEGGGGRMARAARATAAAARPRKRRLQLQQLVCYYSNCCC